MQAMACRPTNAAVSRPPVLPGGAGSLAGGPGRGEGGGRTGGGQHRAAGSRKRLPPEAAQTVVAEKAKKDEMRFGDIRQTFIERPMDGQEVNVKLSLSVYK